MNAQKTAGRAKASKVSANAAASRKIREVKEIKTAKGLFFARILFFTFIIIVLFNFAANLHKINSKKSELEVLEQEHNSQRINNEALKQKLDATVDDDYIENAVKDMGYRKSDEILFYFDSDD